MQDYVKPLCLVDPDHERVSDETLVIHVRSGDIFTPGGAHPSYGQPPISWYEMLIEQSGYEDIVVVTQTDSLNGAANPVLAEIRSRWPRVRFVCGNTESDFHTLRHARHLALSSGTFSVAAALLNTGLERLHVPVYEQHPDPNFVGIFAADEKFGVAGRYYDIRNYQEMRNWSCSAEQLRRMLEHSVDEIAVTDSAPRREKILGVGFPFPAHHSSNSVRRPKLFDWTDDPDQATVGTTVYFGGAIREGIGKLGRKIAWLFESPSINEWQATTPFLVENLDLCLDTYKLILASERSLCELHPRIVFHPMCANLPWISEGRYQIYPKTHLCSMFASAKTMVEEHRIRQGYAEKLKDRLDLFGGACGSPRIGDQGDPPDKSEGLIPYMFSVTKENTNVPFSYTEKITDCFATGTVPVYWGSDCIGELFDTDGILWLDEEFDPRNLSRSLYESMLPAIRNNLEIVKNLEGTDDALYRLYIDPARTDTPHVLAT